MGMDTHHDYIAMSWLADLIGLSGSARQIRAIGLGAMAVAAVAELLAIGHLMPALACGMVIVAIPATFTIRRAYATNRALAAQAEVDPAYRDEQARQARRLALGVAMGVGAPLLAGLLLLARGHGLGLAAELLAELLLAIALGGVIGTLLGTAWGVATHDRPRASILPRLPREPRVSAPNTRRRDPILLATTPPPRLTP